LLDNTLFLCYYAFTKRTYYLLMTDGEDQEVSQKAEPNGT